MFQNCDCVSFQQFSAFNPERSESDQDSQWGGSPLTDSASPQLLDPSEAAEASCAYRLYSDSGSLCNGLGLSEDDLARAQTHPHSTTCDRVRCQSGRYFLGTPQSGREMWWDTTRSVLSLPKFSAENSEAYEITSYHGAIHGEVLGLRPQPSVSEILLALFLLVAVFQMLLRDMLSCLRRPLPVSRLLPSVQKLHAIESQVISHFTSSNSKTAPTELLPRHQIRIPYALETKCLTSTTCASFNKLRLFISLS